MKKMFEEMFDTALSITLREMAEWNRYDVTDEEMYFDESSVDEIAFE